MPKQDTLADIILSLIEAIIKAQGYGKTRKRTWHQYVVPYEVELFHNILPKY
ncbi:hypothetical protein [Seonamhaeicola sp.]|uniref:hypothetical protein n=1 Tax=Seonamhaeicola sp. TaxID=1912245 RepID=UPI0026112A10|nr:hypothetical protein [Seonamhaeicola sp.]